MADIKRKFYNTGEAKGFTKRIFFEAVLALSNGEDIDAETLELVTAAAEYEIDGIDNRPKKAATDKKDALQSPYAQEIVNVMLPMLGTEATPKTANDLIAAAAAAGKKAPSGKDFSVPWVARVLQNHPNVGSKVIVVDTTDAKGLHKQKEVTGYFRV